MIGGILDFGEYFRCNYDDNQYVGVVIRADGNVVRFRMLAKWEQGKWLAHADPMRQPDKVLVLQPETLLQILPEQGAVKLVGRGGDVPAFREWWSGQKVGRR